MIKIKDISDTKYTQIVESSATPLKFRLEWIQNTREQKQALQLFIVKNFDLNINEYYLLVGIPIDGHYLIFTHLCQQAPTFVISDICHILINNTQNHGNNSYLINQYLNANGYKNLEHIVMDIFIQEMTVKMVQLPASDTAILFNDYSYLIHKSLMLIQSSSHALSLASEETQMYFFFLLAIEDSIKKLNQEFTFLFFCFYKISDASIINQENCLSVLQNLKKSYFKKINHHIDAINTSLKIQQKESITNGVALISDTIEMVELQLENLLKNLELFHKKETSVEVGATRSAPLVESAFTER